MVYACDFDGCLSAHTRWTNEFVKFNASCGGKKESDQYKRHEAFKQAFWDEVGKDKEKSNEAWVLCSSARQDWATDSLNREEATARTIARWKWKHPNLALVNDDDYSVFAELEILADEMNTKYDNMNATYFPLLLIDREDIPGTALASKEFREIDMRDDEFYDRYTKDKVRLLRFQITKLKASFPNRIIHMKFFDDDEGILKAVHDHVKNNKKSEMYVSEGEWEMPKNISLEVM